MANRLADLDQHGMARVRAELAEVIADHFAYPTFFDHHANAPRMRPLSAARRQEISQFAHLADFSGVEQIDITSPQVRRVLERVLLRYLELNPDLARPAARQQLALLRVEVPRVAAEIQRGLADFAAGAPVYPGDYGKARPRGSWRGSDGDHDPVDPAHAERSAALIQAALLPRRDLPSADAEPPEPVASSAGEDAAPSIAPHPIMTAAPVPEVSTFWGGYPAPLDQHTSDHFATSQEQTAPRSIVRPPPMGDSPTFDPDGDTAPHTAGNGNGNGNGNDNGHAASMAPAAWAALLRDLTGPVPALPNGRPPAVPSSPFMGLEDGAQSGIFGALPANPFAAPAQALPPAHGSASGNGHHDPFGDDNGDDSDDADLDPRKLPPGLVAMYSAYLRAMRPDPADAAPAATPPAAREQDVWARSTMPPAAHASIPDGEVSAPTGPSPLPPTGSPTPGSVPGVGNDQMIFAQLRNQLDAYLQATARTAGVQVVGSDPERVLAALRRNGRMSAADVRLAESILAITGRVLAGGVATQEDYRRAFMLYLLFHRGRIGA